MKRHIVTGLAGFLLTLALFTCLKFNNKDEYVDSLGGTDTTPPVAGSAITFSAVGSNSLTVTWGAATDAVSAQVDLQYRLVKATTSAAIDTIAEVDAISGGDLLQDYTANDITQNVTGLTASTTYFFAVVVKDAAGNKALYAPQSQATTGPTLLSSTPADTATGVAPCSGSPCTGKIVLVFSESMNTGLTQTLTTEIWNASAYVAAPNTGSTFTWSQTTVSNDTLTVNFSGSWYRFPENSKIQYKLAASGLQDVAANQIAAQVQRSFTTTTANQGFAVADTGQTGCYDDSAADSCVNTATTWPNQDADNVNIPIARSFTGPTQHGTFTSDYTTTDNVTGLVWKSCSEGLSDPACTTGAAQNMTWYNALNQCSALNTMNSGAGYAGKTTWRLPTRRELATLLNYNVVSPSIDTANFPATVANYYWASSTYVRLINYAWSVIFLYGTVHYSSKTLGYYVRCVAGPSITTVAYTDNGDGTVTDTTTNLRWQKCSMGRNNDASCSVNTTETATWSAALQYCDGLTLASKTWRLPSVNELKSLVDDSVYNPSIKTANFPATVVFNYWASSTYVALINYAWVVYFYNGNVDFSHKANSNYVRCVASGP